MKLKIKKGDTVEVIAGAEKGKKGKVLEVQPLKLKIKVEGIRVQTNYDKKEGIKKLEGYLDYSNVRLSQAKAAAPKATEKPKRTVKVKSEATAAPKAAPKKKSVSKTDAAAKA